MLHVIKIVAAGLRLFLALVKTHVRCQKVLKGKVHQKRKISPSGHPKCRRLSLFNLHCFFMSLFHLSRHFLPCKKVHYLMSSYIKTFRHTRTVFACNSAWTVYFSWFRRDEWRKTILWIEDLNLSQNQWFKVKTKIKEDLFLTNMHFSLYRMFIDGLGVWSGVDCGVLSAVWTLILTAPIHYRGSTDEQVISC